MSEKFQVVEYRDSNGKTRWGHLCESDYALLSNFRKKRVDSTVFPISKDLLNYDMFKLGGVEASLHTTFPYLNMRT